MHGTPLNRLAIPKISPLGSILAVYEFFEGIGVEPRGALRSFGYYCATLITRGQGTFRGEKGPPQRLAAGSIIITLPGSRHWFGSNPGETWDELFVIFTGPGFDLLTSLEILRKGRRIFRPHDWEAWRSEILRLSEIDSISAITSLMAILMQLSETTEIRPEDAILSAKKHLSRDLHQELDIHAMASDLGVGYEVLRKRFRESVGVGIREFRNRCRFDHARDLLSNTDLTLETIATEVGYSSAFTFSRAFFREYDVWPSVWRDEATWLLRNKGGGESI